jgi:hypothetical protein
MLFILSDLGTAELARIFVLDLGAFAQPAVADLGPTERAPVLRVDLGTLSERAIPQRPAVVALVVVADLLAACVRDPRAEQGENQGELLHRDILRVVTMQDLPTGNMNVN